MNVQLNTTSEVPFLDLTKPDHGVSVEASADRTVLWVNVDGQCVLRVCQIPTLHVDVPGGEDGK